LTASLLDHFGDDNDRPLDILGVDLDDNLIDIAQKKFRDRVKMN
jgi:hypothetical protein